MIVTLNVIPALSARVELLRGGAPSRCEITLPPGSPIEPGAALVLSMADGRTSRELRQFIAREVATLGDGRVQVGGRDLREQWQRPVHADINMPVGDGTAWPEGEPVSAQQAVNRMFESAGLGDAPVLPAAPVPVNVRARGSLGAALEAMLRGIGLTLGVDDDGHVVVTHAGESPTIDASTVIESLETRGEQPERVSAIGGPALELLQIDSWQTVLPDDDGVLRPLSDVLADWGIDAVAARKACLSDGGFVRLLPRTGSHREARLATLQRYAYRLLRAASPRLPWLPVGGVHDDGTLRPPVLSAGIDRSMARAPEHPGQRVIEEYAAEPVEGFELDAERGLVFLPRPPFDIGDNADATLQSGRVRGEPRLRLKIAVAAERPPFVREVSTGGHGEPVALHASHLVAIYDDGNLLNRALLNAAADAMIAGVSTPPQREVLMAGVHGAPARGTCASVIINAGRDGLTTRVIERAAALNPAPPPEARRLAGSRAAAPVPSGLYQPINAYRAGPLVIAAGDDVPEGESVPAMRAAAMQRETGALELADPGPLALPFFLPSDDAAKFGRWFFVAGVEVADSGRLRVLAPDDRHAEQPPATLFAQRHELPVGLRGLLVNIGDNVCVDTGPLTADARGREPGATSSLVYDLDGSRLSERKRGGLQFLTVLALSPAHRAEGCRDKGWVPALNLREGDTASPELLGRGLFAEGDGRKLGRLTAIQQGGPVLADSDTCAKHLYGAASDDDGLYRESAGHISTDAFFKIPGDPVHDAPLKFYAQPFVGRVPAWRPFEAQIKYDASAQHPWNRRLRDGRWKIQYRVPFLPEIPPTWRPPIIPPPTPPVDDPPPHVPAMSYVPRQILPTISEHELWAPSHDWLPAPSRRDFERDVPFRGPSVTSEGWAAEVDGVPDPSLGGGCIYLPPGVPLSDAQQDSGARQTYLGLHPEVVLAIGHPHFENGGVHSGWTLQQFVEGGHLQIAPRDANANIPPVLDRELQVAANLNVAGKLTVAGLIDPTGLELMPQAANPGNAPANTLWLDGTAGNRARIGDQALAYAADLPGLKIATISYVGNGTSGRTVALTGIHRAFWIAAFRAEDAAGNPAWAFPFGATGAVRWRAAGNEAPDSISLDASSSDQTLTINNTLAEWNSNGGAYRLLVIGTSTEDSP